jgi:hypothetical protein
VAWEIPLGGIANRSFDKLRMTGHGEPVEPWIAGMMGIIEEVTRDESNRDLR